MSVSLKIVDHYPPVPEAEVSVRPQCEASLKPYLQERIQEWKQQGRNWYANKKPGKPEGTCANKARYKINGKWYCRKHAGLLVLDAMAKVEGK